MRGVEIVLNLKILRRHLRGLTFVAGVGLVLLVLATVPALRTRFERAADRLIAVFIPTPPATPAPVFILPITPTQTPTGGATATPRTVRRETPTPAPTSTPAPTPTPPPTRDPEVVYPGRVLVRVSGRDIVAVVHPPRVRHVAYRYNARARRWEPVSVTVPATVDTNSIEFLLTVVVPEKGLETSPDFLALDLRTLDTYEVQVRPDGQVVVRVLDVPVASGFTYRIEFRAQVSVTPDASQVLETATTFTY